MSLYFLLLDAPTFHERIVPPLAACWRDRSFAPCRVLAEELRPMLHGFRENFFAGAEEPLIVQAARGMPFDRHIWRALVGEVLLLAAAEVPELQTAPEALCCLLAPDAYALESVARECFAPIQQAHFGSRDLRIGKARYGSDHVGINALDDVARLANYLARIDPERWTISDIAAYRDAADDVERSEELEFVREWFPSLQGVYRRAHDQGQVVICEVL